jgi:epoxyqueuosine reductase
LKDALVARAKELGFDAVKVTKADAIPQALDRLKAWIANGNHGSMAWMENRVDQRGNPKSLWPEAETVIMLGLNYAPDTDPLVDIAFKNVGAISAYARRRDYHDVIKGRLKTIASFLPAKAGAQCKVFVDTAPIMEKALAQAAGLGWQGKHTVLVSREHGSWLFLGAIFTTAKLPPDVPEIDHCGSCRRCLDSCPTQAFPEPYVLDSRRCIAYLTIEHDGPIDNALRTPIGNRIFGCDDCIAVCPWNKFAATAKDIKSSPNFMAWRLKNLHSLMTWLFGDYLQERLSSARAVTGSYGMS